MRMRYVIFMSVVSLAVPYFSTFSHKRHDFWGKNIIGHKMCVFWFSAQLLCKTFIILKRSQRDTVISVHKSLCQASVILVRFWWKLNFLYRFTKNTQTWNLMKICSVEAKLFHADGRTDKHHYANNRFSGLCNQYCDSLRTGRPGDRIPVAGEIFRVRPDLPWGPPSFLYNGYRVFLGGKAAGAWRWPPTHHLAPRLKRE